MTGDRAQLFVVWVMRLMALGFLVVGISFILDPDGTILRIDATGGSLGDYSSAPLTGDKLWLALSFAYMMVIAALAWMVQKDVVKNRQLILVLFLAKATSSLAALYFFLFDLRRVRVPHELRGRWSAGDRGDHLLGPGGPGRAASGLSPWQRRGG